VVVTAACFWPRYRLGEIGADRWVVAGDFFTEAPPGDIYLFKRILYDWEDRQCR
jgi:hypothetical protein